MSTRGSVARPRPMVDAQSAESQVQLITLPNPCRYLSRRYRRHYESWPQSDDPVSLYQGRGLSRLGIAGGVVQEWEHTNKSPIVSLPICPWCPPSVLRPPGETSTNTSSVCVCVCVCLGQALPRPCLVQGLEESLAISSKCSLSKTWSR